jgi:hypothetical protein
MNGIPFVDSADWKATKFGQNVQSVLSIKFEPRSIQDALNLVAEEVFSLSSTANAVGEALGDAPEYRMIQEMSREMRKIADRLRRELGR